MNQLREYSPTITQIGSLPYDNVRQAIDYSLRHDIPFLPELPKIGESMLEYIKTPGKLVCLKEFKQAVKGFPLVKIQSVGPATILSDTKNNYTEQQAFRMTKEHLLAVLDGLDAKKIICFFDEPSLETAGFDYTSAEGMKKEEYEALGLKSVNYRLLWDELYEELSWYWDEQRVKFGVHTCSNFNWEELFEPGFLDIISFDASKYAQKFVASKGYRTGKDIAWGIKKKSDALSFKRGDLLTPPCGLGNLANPDECESILENLIKIEKEI